MFIYYSTYDFIKYLKSSIAHKLVVSVSARSSFSGVEVFLGDEDSTLRDSMLLLLERAGAEGVRTTSSVTYRPEALLSFCPESWAAVTGRRMLTCWISVRYLSRLSFLSRDVLRVSISSWRGILASCSSSHSRDWEIQLCYRPLTSNHLSGCNNAIF